MATVYKSLSKANGSKDDESKGAPRKNKQRVLVLSSRGVTYRSVAKTTPICACGATNHKHGTSRHRHLLNDLAAMMPHGRKDAKFDSKSKLYQLNELAELYNCNNVLFFEARKGQDLYMWASKVPNGPTVKMHVQNSKKHHHAQGRGNKTLGLTPTQCIPWRNSISQETASKAPDPSYPSTLPSTKSPT